MTTEGMQSEETLAPPRSRGRFRRATRPVDWQSPRVDLSLFQRERVPVLEEGAAPDRTNVREGMYRRSLALADSVAAVLVVLVGLPILTGQSRPTLAVVAAFAMVLLNKAFRLYERDDVVLNKTTLDEVPTLAQSAATATLLLWLALDGLTTVALQPGNVIEIWAANLGLTVCGRLLTRKLLSYLAPTERCVVAGEGSGARAVVEKIEASGLNATVVALVVEDDPSPLTEADTESRFRRLLVKHQADRAIIVPGATDAAGTLELIRIAKHAGVRVTVVPQLFDAVGSSVEFDELDGLTMLGVRSFSLTRSTRILKRVFDLVGATLLLVVTAPLMAVIAIAIRLDTRGPVMFRQTRVGKDGRRFEMRKFRSMTIDADAHKESLRDRNELYGLFKIPDDPRVTTVGRLLRKTSLDELPQLFNVWRGEMSLVGPRPLVVDEDALVTGYHRARLHLTPGMTGPWQVLGSGRIPMNEMVAIDCMYVANWSLWTDVKILLRTIPHVLASRGM